MSYAVKKDEAGNIIGWRAVDSLAECDDDEEWQEEQPPILEPVPPLEMDPVNKLKAFLAANPDVAALLGV